MKTTTFFGAITLAILGSALGCSSSPGGAGEPPAATSESPLVVAGTSLRRPQGLYVHVELDKLTDGPGDWTDYLECYFGGLLLNPAVSGIELSVYWSSISGGADASGGPDPLQNSWAYVDAAFDQVEAWNAAHPKQTPKTIQLIVIPGFKSPSWLLGELPPCDPLFSENLTSLPGCGSIQIAGYAEGGNTETTWPLPWDPTYKSAWRQFLTQLDTRYGSRSELVSISMAGPTGTSAEMFVPHNNTSQEKGSYGDLTQTYGSTSISVNDVIARLVANGSPSTPASNPDEAFVTAWADTVTTYAKIFQNLTLILTPAEGGSFPDLAPVDVPDGGTDSDIVAALCPKTPNGTADDMSCTTTAAIMGAFRSVQLPNGNGKASQMSGLGTPIAKGATSDAGTPDTGSDFGIRGVRWLAQNTAADGAQNQIVAGAQFTAPFLEKNEKQCTGKTEKSDCTVEQVVFNVLGTAFYDTAAGCFFDFPTTDLQPLNFMQIFADDYTYAIAHASEPVTFQTTSGRPITATAQDLLDASYRMIGQVSQPPVSTAAVVCEPSFANSVPPTPPVCVAPPGIACDPACDSSSGYRCDTATGTCVLVHLCPGGPECAPSTQPTP